MPVVTLTTDFGTADGYVGAMKGILAARAPAAVVVDITHEVPRHDVAHAAYVLAIAARWFPAGTIHVVVVDPGVGSDRQPIVLSAGGQLYVGPDNGMFALVAEGSGWTAFAIESDRFRLPEVSTTFHGRDVFAPAAAALARGAEPAEAGAAVPALQPLAGVGTGPRIVHIDTFGNLITNLRPADASRGFGIRGHQFDTLHPTFSSVEPGELLAYVGSSGFVEVAVREGSAAEVMGAGRGEAVNVP